MKQPKKPVAKSAKLSPSRVRKVADSLMAQSEGKKGMANFNQSIANSAKKYVGKPVDSLMKTDWGKLVKVARAGYTMTSDGKLGDTEVKRREQIAEGQRKSASVDSSNAVRYRKLADKATKKK
jgi:hypothetical protein